MGKLRLRAWRFDPFVTVGDHLRPQRRIPTYPNYDMPPLGVHQVNVIMIDVRPFLLGYKFLI
jgi:hypothetical protein